MQRHNHIPPTLSSLKQKRDEEASKASRPLFQNKAARVAAAKSRVAGRKASPATRDFAAAETASSSGATSSSQKRARPPQTNSSDDEKERYNRLPQYVMSARKKERRLRFDWDPSDDTTNDDDYRSVRLSQSPAMRFGHVRVRKMSEIETTRSRTADERHWSEKQREEMTDRDWRIFREDFLITIRGPAPRPSRTWNETDLPEALLYLVREVAHYKSPSPIQMAAIPIALSGRDLIGLAETGSGKTAAFVLPMLVHIGKQPHMSARIASRGPYVLILAPTRELALQIESEAKRFGDPSGYRTVAIIGGQELDVQAMYLQAGCEVIVCTPGRMVDLLSKQMAALGNCNYLILDEGDRMIDMGFEPQLAEILACMPDAPRQTFMFSATMSPSVERIAKSYLADPVVISVGEKGKAADNVDQRVEYLSSEARRRERLVALLQTLEPPILVFANTRSGCEMITRYIENNSYIRPVIMHSGKSQEQREKTLQGFKSGRHKVLVATDVVGRGIDIKGVRNVINYELPKNIEAYTHRIGRTGRAGEKGTAWSLAVEADAELFGPLAQTLKQSNAVIPPQVAKEANKKSMNAFRPITD